MPVLTSAHRVRRWSVRCTVDGREARFEAETREEALDIARRFIRAFGPSATAHVVGTQRITSLP